MISKELMCEVLGCDFIYNIESPFIEYVYYDVGIDQTKRINSYELVNDCKQWALKQGYQFRTTQLFNNFYLEFGKQGNGFPIDIKHEGLERTSDYFDMCQWILNDKATK